MSIDPVTFMDTGSPGMFNRYAYVENDPINHIDPTGEIKVVVTPVKIIGKSIIKRQSPLKSTVQEAVGIADDIGTLLDGQLTFGDVAAIPDLVLGTEFNNPKAKGIPKPPRGKGSVPKDQRDPQRRFTDKQQQEMIDRQGGKCANGCGKDIDVSNSQGHHVQRHADGGPTTLDNGVQPCTDCHKKIHSKDD